jgi:hypothetical protein
MTDEEIERFALVLKECERIRALIAREEADDERAAYPSFGVYYNSRTEPIIGLVIKDKRAREVLLPKLPDERLANIVKILDEQAGREFVMFDGWDSDSWQDSKIRSFLNQFPDQVL